MFLLCLNRLLVMLWCAPHTKTFKSQRPRHLTYHTLLLTAAILSTIILELPVTKFSVCVKNPAWVEIFSVTGILYFF